MIFTSRIDSHCKPLIDFFYNRWEIFDCIDYKMAAGFVKTFSRRFDFLGQFFGIHFLHWFFRKSNIISLKCWILYMKWSFTENYCCIIVTQYKRCKKKWFTVFAIPTVQQPAWRPATMPAAESSTFTTHFVFHISKIW